MKNQLEIIGYLLLACKETNLDQKTVRKLKSTMNEQMKIKSSEEAINEGYRWFYSFLK
jgi:hypothetical protein